LVTSFRATVIDHLQWSFETRNIGVVFLYCDYRDQTNQTCINLLSSILKQLLQNRPEIINQFNDLIHEKLDGENKLSIGKLSAALETVVLSFSKVFIIVDGLDKCSPENETSKALLGKLLSVPGIPAIMITSRLHAPVEVTSRDHASLEIIENQGNDLHRYVKMRISANHPLDSVTELDPLMKDRIVNGVVECSKGL
jgi:hypothetical protein